MSEKKYIERETAINKACEGCNVEFDDQPCEPSDCYIRNKLLAIPVVDVAPRSEVAREIFEGLERMMLDGAIGGKYPAKVINSDKYAEFKKKYVKE